ncbi:MAG: hypothetical protein WBB07_18860 [Mycobacterium sp.]
MRALGRNPVIRVSDRLEALTALAVLVLAVVAVPLAVEAGQQVYEARKQTAQHEALTRHSVDAEVLTGSTGLSTDFDGTAFVRVQWREQTGVRTAQVITPGVLKTGDRITVWLDQSGKVVGAPSTESDATVSAVAAGAVVWTAVLAGSVIFAFAARRGLDRSRARLWERELLLLAHNDDGWANRHN